MDLTEDQCQEFRDRGWIVLSDVFGPEEVELLSDAALDVLERPGPEVDAKPMVHPTCLGACTFSTNS